MTTQDKINQLAQAALRSAPPSATAPKPATFMPSFEKLRSPDFAAPGSRPAAAPAPAPAPEPGKEAPAAAATAPAAFADTPDTEFRSMIETRDEKMLKKRSRTSLAISIAVLTLFAAGGTWLTVSPSGRSKMNTLVQALKQSGEDAKGMASMMGTYDKQLEQVSVQSARIDEAARALGADPTADASAQDDEIAAAMKQMSGSEGPTSGERDQLLKQKFGVVAKVADRKAGPEPAKESDVKF